MTAANSSPTDLTKRALRRVFRRFRPTEAYLSFSQEGEDMIVRSILMNKQPGFYVDAGAHEPDRYSNTAWFYRHGWSGINIEANPQLGAKLEKKRSRDINVVCGVGSALESLDFFVFNEAALSTFDAGLAQKYESSNPNWFLTSTQKVAVRPLSEILDQHVPPGQLIDFLTVDVEGWDLDVLQSNDWERYLPTVVAVECHGNDCRSVEEDPVSALLCPLGYVPVAKTFSTVIFVQPSQLPART
jgi:FkbM family methyltransferase